MLYWPIFLFLLAINQVSEPTSKIDPISAEYLPTFSCLFVSPGNIWQNGLQKFLNDKTIIKTLYSIKDLASPDSTGSLREILFGIPWMETGIKRLFVRTRQRTITYVITLIYKKYNIDFANSMRKFLRARYSINPFIENATDSSHKSDFAADSEDDTTSFNEDNITHLYFHTRFTFSDFLPLGATYVMLFLYIYFSVRKCSANFLTMTILYH